MQVAIQTASKLLKLHLFINQVIKKTAVTIGQFSSLLQFNKLLAKILHTSV